MRRFKSSHLAGPATVVWALILCLLSIGGIGCQGRTELRNPAETIINLQHRDGLVVRFAKLRVDSTRLDEYLSILCKGIEASITNEPGVLTMCAVQDEEDPSEITVLEIYASDSAYRLHLKSDHFQRYKTGTLDMVESLDLIDLDPIIFGNKSY